MLILEEAILVNKFGQELVSINGMVDFFSKFDLQKKRDFLAEIISLIIQSKPQVKDIELAIEDSGLKPTYTPCVLLKKGIAKHNLQKIVNLPEEEYMKSFVLLLSLFKAGYKRRFNIEKDNPDKWWYWDLSDSRNVEMILNKASGSI